MKKIILITLTLALLLAGCNNAAPSNDANPAADTDIADTGIDTGDTDSQFGATSFNAALLPQPVKALNADFVDGINAFGIDAAALLYSEDQNLAISPVSIELALAMTQAGADGETADEMKTALGLSGISDEQIAAACKSLMWRANTGGMQTANALWQDGKYTLTDEYLATCTQDYMADALPLVVPGAMDAINAWASDKTNGRIESILEEELDKETRIVLTSALYFLGDWETPFEAYATHDGLFYAPDGSVTVPFMNSDRAMPYYKGDEFSMISLDFKSEAGEGQYAMAFLLPDEGSNIPDMLDGLAAQTFSAALNAMEEQTLLTALPKFEYIYSAPLAHTLKSLGMVQAFDFLTADFSAMTKEDNSLYIVHVLHKCYIRIDELGAEAAAVTEVTMADGCAEVEPLTFFANRPFVFAIYSREDGAIAFMGAVNDPTK